jgi:hypothetical protein
MVTRPRRPNPGNFYAESTFGMIHQNKSVVKGKRNIECFVAVHELLNFCHVCKCLQDMHALFYIGSAQRRLLPSTLLQYPITIHLKKMWISKRSQAVAIQYSVSMVEGRPANLLETRGQVSFREQH